MDRRAFTRLFPAALATLIVPRPAVARGGGGKGGGKGKGGSKEQGGGPEDSPLNVEQIVKAPTNDKRKSIKIHWGSDKDVNVSIKSGAVATINVKIKGRATIQVAKIVQRPSHGGATASGYLWVYRSWPGFSGADSFVVEAEGSDRLSSGTSRVTVAVTVEP